jgi:NADH-quinone oxidoreductase subunit N
LLAATMTLAMVSLAGIPPLAGFFGKFLLLKAVIEQGATNGGFYCLAFVALAGVIISFFYYFSVIRAIYWSKETPVITPIVMSRPIQFAVWLTIAGMLYLGLFPDAVLKLTSEAVAVLK